MFAPLFVFRYIETVLTLLGESCFFTPQQGDGMKSLKIFAFAVILLVIGFVLIGMISPTVSFTTSVMVEEPVEKAFAVFMDLDKMGGWLTGFQGIELVSGRLQQPGSTYRLRFVEDGREIVFQEDHEIMSTHSTIRFRRIGSSTEITAANVVEGTTFFWRSILPLIQGSMEERQEKDFRKLKLLIESQE
jgi:hypothetical protein